MKTLFAITLVSLALIFYSCQDSTDLNVNNAPVAVFCYFPTVIDTATIVTFTALGSSDPEDPAALLLYCWDYECVHNWTEETNNIEGRYKFCTSGTYKVKLKVIDTEGWSGECEKTIIVHDSI